MLQAGGDLGVLVDADRVGGGVGLGLPAWDWHRDDHAHLGIGRAAARIPLGGEQLLGKQVDIGPCQQLAAAVEGDAIGIGGNRCGERDGNAQ